MKKVLIIGVSIILTAVLIISALLIMKKKNQENLTNKGEEVLLETEENPLKDSDFLSVDGTRIVNQDGETIRFCGVNLGGWLIQEYWMCPVKGDSLIEKWTESQTISTLEKRFGAKKALELMEIYRDNWICEWDIQKISEMGCNVIRVPFWYRNFMLDEYGTYITKNDDENPGFKHLDWIIETAGKYGLYVILDMHGCPGGQSLDHTTGTYNQAKLYTDEKCQTAMKDLWLKISDRYKNNSTVAAYDIMNEPYLDSFKGGESDKRNIIYNNMYDAIRNNGDEHIIIFEGIWQLAKLPTPDGTKTNLCYSVHLYGDFDANGSAKAYSDYSIKNNIPVYIGEFSNQQLYYACETYGISCTAWAYKGATDSDPWFMFASSKLKWADIVNDSYDEIASCWGENIRTYNGFEEKSSATAYYKSKKQ